MAFLFCNPNPQKNLVGDCVIRAVSLATDTSWEDTYLALSVQGYKMCDMPSSNAVWGQYLIEQGFTRHLVSETCTDCTIANFVDEHRNGTYVLATGTHVVTAKDGDYMDTWDSGNEYPIYYFTKEA